jgi:hypothetical protein
MFSLVSSISFHSFSFHLSFFFSGFLYCLFLVFSCILPSESSQRQPAPSTLNLLLGQMEKSRRVRRIGGNHRVGQGFVQMSDSAAEMRVWMKLLEVTAAIAV